MMADSGVKFPSMKYLHSMPAGDRKKYSGMWIVSNGKAVHASKTEEGTWPTLDKYGDTDEQPFLQYIFENNLTGIPDRFQRLASIHFAETKDSFVKPAFQATVTGADGNEHRNVVSIRPEHKKKIAIADRIIKGMKKSGLTKHEMGGLLHC